MRFSHPALAVVALFGVLASVTTAAAQVRPRGTANRPARLTPPPPPPPPEPVVAPPPEQLPPPPGPPPEPVATASQMQATLQLMRDKGLITPTEYDEALAGITDI